MRRQYQHIDILEFMPLASVIFQGVSNANRILTEVQEMLSSAWWEGDGDVPRSLNVVGEDTWGVPTCFVKQSSNGTAFIASPVLLPFARLLEQQ